MTEISEIVEQKESVIPKEVNDFIDKVEERMITELVGSGEFEIKHREPVHLFTPGLYSREFTMLPGDRVTSKIHLSEHQYILSQGSAIVFQDGKEVILTAPCRGVTKAGTRRILQIPDNSLPCVWTTFHRTDIMPKDESKEAVLEAVAKIEEAIIEKHENLLLKNINLTTVENV